MAQTSNAKALHCFPPCQLFAVQNIDQPYVVVSSALPTTCHSFSNRKYLMTHKIPYKEVWISRSTDVKLVDA